MAMQTKELLAKRLKVRGIKAYYSAQLDRCKEGENKLVSLILKEMEENGVDSIRTEGYTLSKTKKDHLEIADKEKFLTAMYNDMADAKAHGESLATACLLQQRPAKKLLMDLITSAVGDDLKDIIVKAQELGLNYVVESDLSVRKAK